MTKTHRIAAAVLVALATPVAFAQATAAQATATFDRIRTTPAELKLHCEQLKLQGDSISVSMKGDKTEASRMGNRINEIQEKLPGYKEAVNFVADKAVAGGIAYFRSGEGKTLDEAQKKLANACVAGAGAKKK